MPLYIDTDKFRKLIEAGRNMKSYHHRFIMGVTALPLIASADYFILSDKEKKNESLSRNMAKIIAGVLTGVAVRYGTYKFVKKYGDVVAKPILENKVKITGEKTWFYPKEFLGEFEGSKADWDMKINNYHNTLSTYIAIGAMLFTNFLADMPLTLALTNFFRTHVFNDDIQTNIFETPQIQRKLAFLSNSQNILQKELK